METSGWEREPGPLCVHRAKEPFVLRVTWLPENSLVYENATRPASQEAGGGCQLRGALVWMVDVPLPNPTAVSAAPEAHLFGSPAGASRAGVR